MASENLLLLSGHLATKDDVTALRTELTVQFEKVDKEFVKMRSEMATEFANVRREMADLENRLLFRLGGLMVALLSAFAAVIKWG